ncbi:MAG: hypothetical protein QOE82_1549, partial [Thermoanaerobaculia bacterium]|nr:hypothetical protein [Thermoanaerobaculia bacterium]
MAMVRNRLFVAAGGAVVLVTILLVAFLRQTPSERFKKAVATLRRRPVHGRLTEFPYAPLAGASLPAARNSLRLLQAATSIAALPANTPEELHLRGIARLVLDDLSAGVSDLDAARAARPNDARFLNDYSAAVMEKAFRNDNAELMIEALTAADRASAMKPRLPEAVFNRALALEGIGLESVADKTFKDYLVLDTSSRWATEARKHVSMKRKTAADRWEAARAGFEAGTLDGQAAAALATQFPQEIRTWGEGEYLARWAEAVAQHDESTAKHWVQIAQRLGDALQSFSGESLLHDATVIASQTRGKRRAHLARAHILFRQARILYGRRLVSQARPEFENAAREFAAAGSPMAYVVAYYLANVAYDQSDAAGCLKQLDILDRRTPSRYPALKAEIQWTRASAFARTNRLYESSDAAQSALKLFERLRENDNLTSVRSSVAGTLSHLGREFEAWRFRRAVFRSASESGRAYILELALASAARGAVRRNRTDIARALLSAQLELPADSPRVHFDAVLGHTFAFAKEESRPLTNEEKRELDHSALTISDAGLRRDALDDARLAEAIALRPHDARRALALLDATLAERFRRHRPLDVTRILLERARALRAIGRTGEATATLEEAVQIIEGQHQAIPQLDLRDSYLGSSDAAFTDLADLMFAAGNAAGAFGAVERARGQAITERLADGRRHPAANLEDVAHRLAPGAALLEWVSVENRTWAVMVCRAGWRWAALPVSMRDLERRAASFRNAIAKGNDEGSRSEGEALYTLLFAPVLRSTDKLKLLVVVPDPSMDAIPFAALRNQTTGRFLIEDHEIVSSPSAAAYLTSSNQKPSQNQSHIKVVLAGDPIITSPQFAALNRLPEASGEIRSIAAMYPESIARSGAAATRQWFTQESATADIIHVAAHAVLNGDEPWLSVLPLAADTTGDGLLYVRDIAS